MASIAPATAAPLERIPAALWRQAAILVVGGFLSRLTTSIVNIGLVPMGEGFGVPLDTMQWVATGYLLALAASIPVSAWAARRVGPTRLWLASLTLFTLASTACALAATAGQLIAARVLLGLCGGLLVPVGQMLLGMAAGPGRMGRLMATMGVVVVLAPAIGSTVGSALLAWRGWPWLFWINVPLGLAALLAGWRWLPRVDAGAAGRLDIPGLVLLSLGLPLMTWGVSAIAQSGGFGPAAGGALLLGVALVAGFALRARRAEAPLIRIRLLGQRVFGPAGAILFCAGFTVYGAQIVLPLYYLLVRHETVFMTGLLILPQDLGIALAMPLSGRLADRFGGGRLVVAGIALTMLGTVPLAFLAADTGYVWLSLVLAVRGFGMVLAAMPAMTVALASLPRERVPDGVPLLNILDRTGASIGTALAVALFGLFLPAGPADAVGALTAFGATHAVLALVAAAPLLPALALLRAERRA
ncbi:DHA2 family efflux MFS transporter permease subunit [Inquilinus limosus]|uniref:DHA2 family efflux MFS transporter permease subunit n=1 Tax=Inquilinus limosus TaxID=171674 RepID=UPI00041C1B8D|nr:DHA2 family efflux MFS transporter permease subunit [Inquilinus limosus]